MEAAAQGFYDRQGQRIDLATLLHLKADEEYRFLARDVVGEVEVVTAWLGTDQLDADDPLIFGTVGLLRGQEGELFQDVELFAGTEAVALENHQRLLDRVRAASRP